MPPLTRLILLAIAAAGVAVISYCIVHLDSFVYDDIFDVWRYDKPGVISFFVLPMLVSVLALWAATRQAAARRRALIRFAAVFVAIYAGEIYVAFQPPPIPGALRYEAAKAAGRPFDPRSRMEVVTDMRKTGQHAYPYAGRGKLLEHGKWRDGRLVSPILVDGAEVVPLAGISGKPSVLCNEPGPWLSYRSDRFGFNNPDALWERADIQVAMVGDSLPHGYCLPADSHATPRLRAAYPKLVNLGFAGSGALEYLGTLMEYGPLIKPSVVLWIHYENDVRDMELEKANDVQMRYAEPGHFRQRIPERQTAVDAATMKFIDDYMNEHGTSLLGERRFGAVAVHRDVKYSDVPFLRHIRNVFKIYYRKETSDLELFTKVMAKAKEITASWGGQLYFVFRPFGDRGYGETIVRRQYDYERKRVLGIINSLGLPIIDLLPVFKQNLPEQWTLYPGSHYTKAGNFLFADTIINRLKSDGIVARP